MEDNGLNIGYATRIAKFYIRRLKADVEVNDILEHIIQIPIDKIPEFESDNHQFNWLNVTIKNKIMVINRKKTIRITDYDLDLPLNITDKTKSHKELVEEELLVNDILTSIEKKDAKMAFILRLRMEEKTWKEIGSSLHQIGKYPITGQGVQDYFKNNIEKYHNFFKLNGLF